MDKDKVLPVGIVGMGSTDTIVVDMDMDIVDEADNVDEVDDKDDGVHEQRKLDDEHAPDELLDEAEPRQVQELWLELQCKFKP